MSDGKEKVQCSRSIECLNCETTFEGNFCPECGQKATTGRLTFNSILGNVMAGLTNFSSGMLFTVIKLFTHPGEAVRRYIEGSRIAYSKPFSFLFVLCTVWGILYFVTKYYFPDTFANVVIDYDDSAAKYTDWTYSNVIVQTLVELPFTALGIKWLFKKENGGRYNYTELLYMAAFIGCQRMIVSIITLPVDSFMSQYVAYLAFAMSLSTFLAAWTCKGFFAIGWTRAILKSIPVALIGLAGISLVTFIVMACLHLSGII